MPPSMLLVLMLVTVGVGALAWVTIGSLQPDRGRALANLQRGLETERSDASAKREAGLAALARRLTPPSLVGTLDNQHARAGRPAKWPMERLLVLKLLWVPLAVAAFLLALLSRQSPMLLLIIVLVGSVVYFLPELLLLSRGQERDQRIEIELADTLDQMTIAVEAGLAFDSAMSRAAANGHGALAEELTRTLQDMRMGRSRREAFEDLAERNQVADLRQFVRAILQADAYGISIGDVLRTQAAEMRLKRRQRAEEKAQKVPVKVLMPLMLFILPVMFIVVMAPAVLNMIAAFSNV